MVLFDLLFSIETVTKKIRITKTTQKKKNQFSIFNYIYERDIHITQCIKNVSHFLIVCTFGRMFKNKHFPFSLLDLLLFVLFSYET